MLGAHEADISGNMRNLMTLIGKVLISTIFAEFKLSMDKKKRPLLAYSLSSAYTATAFALRARAM